jgi:hypothetical protein
VTGRRGILLALAAVVTGLSGGPAAADPATGLTAEAEFEAAVTELARSYHPGGAASDLAPDDVLVPLRKAGLVGRSFDGTWDYYAWVRPRRPLSFLGHPVELVITEQKRGAFIGCCVDDGLTLVLGESGDRAALQQFADDLHCRLDAASSDSRADEALKRSRPKVDPATRLALECHFGVINQ